MRIYLIATQIVYAIGLAPWVFIWGITLMGLANGINWFSATLSAAITLYPIAAIACSIFAWRLRSRRLRIAVVVNLIPMAWILGAVVPFAIINL